MTSLEGAIVLITGANGGIGTHFVHAALERGAASAVALLGRNNGFLGNPKVRIELPGFLKDAAKLLKATGQGKRVDELVTAMNRAAEAAVPEAKEPRKGFPGKPRIKPVTV